MIVGLHWFLALASAAAMALVGLEAAVRAVQQRAPGVLTARASAAVLVLLGITAAGGLGIFLGGGRPHEWLHFLYAVLAFAAVPVTDVVAHGASPRTRALATAIAALVGLVLILRLFMTG